MDGHLEVSRVGPEGAPWGELVEPDATAIWPRFATIGWAWLLPDDATLIVGGYRGFETVLHSVEVDESADEVGLLARIGFTLEAARWRLEASEAPGEASIGIPWHTAVLLQSRLSHRAVIDWGVLQLQLSARKGGESLSDKVISRLKSELSVAKTPSERRRIRQTIKAIRRNPFKAISSVPPGEHGQPEADL